MYKKVEAKRFDFKGIKGISKNQLQQHYKLYERYVNKTNEIWSELSSINKFSGSNTTYSLMRSLLLGQSYAVDGVKLHELYFENLCGEGKGISTDVLNLLKRDFGGYERWLELFINAGMSVRGWVVLGIDYLDNRLHIYGSDAHDVGSIWNSYPVLVLDVYEHAYMIDFGIKRRKYLDKFIENISWDIVNIRMERFKKIAGI